VQKNSKGQGASTFNVDPEIFIFMRTSNTINRSNFMYSLVYVCVCVCVYVCVCVCVCMLYTLCIYVCRYYQCMYVSYVCIQVVMLCMYLS